MKFYKIAFILRSFLILFIVQLGTVMNAQCDSQNELYIVGSTQVCANGNASVFVIGDFETYVYDNNFWNNDSIPNLVTDSVGLYRLHVTDSLGCTNTAIIEITSGTDLGLQIGGSQFSCRDSSTIYSGYNFQDYLWSTGDTTADVQVYQTGTYIVSVTDFNGCTGVDSIFVELQADTVNPVIATCPGNGTPIEIPISPNDPCDSSNPLIEIFSGFPVKLQWTALSTVLDFPGVATDNSNNGLAHLIEYRDNIILTSCENSNTIYEFNRTWRVSDFCGNIETCSQVIRLLDVTPPTLIEGIDFFLDQDSNNPNGPFSFQDLYCPSSVLWNDPIGSDIFDACNSDIRFISSHAPGSSFGAGITAVSYVIEDDCGNQTEYIFDIEFDCVGCNVTSQGFDDCTTPITYCDLADINNYSACTPEYQGQILGGLCDGGALNNPSYFNFIAGASSITLTITPGLCTPGEMGFIGIQANVTDPCNAINCYGSSGADCFNGVFSFQASGLVVGNEYQIVVDGCAGSECQWSMRIDSEPTFNNLEVENLTVENYNFPNCSEVNDNYCIGTDLIFAPENLFNSEFYFCWTINNTNGVTALNESTNCLAAANTNFACNGNYSTCGPLILSFDQVGTYQVCLTEIESGCDNEVLTNHCYDVNINNGNDINFGSFNVCESNLPLAPIIAGPNGETWIGNTSLVAGLNTISNEDSCGCNTSQSININVIPDQTQNIFVDICDYELNAFIDTQYDVSWADLQPTYNTQTNTASIIIDNGSMQTQFDGSTCGIQLNYQFFIHQINGSIVRLEGANCNSTLEFILDQSSFPPFMVEGNILYKWFSPDGVLISNDRTVDILIDGNYILNVEYIKSDGSACVFPFQFNAIGASQSLFTYYIDIDGDGFGNTNNFVMDCVQPLGYSPNFGDCNDSAPNIHPGAPEVPNNGIDENCDGIDTMTASDNDNDGYTDDVDCDDNNPAINPNAVEIPNNIIDENCDGTILIIDLDGDGFNSDEDCNDSNPLINPNAQEIANNQIDENCDGIILSIDADNDGYNSDEDCNDDDPAINPGADEIPNNTIDENCDGLFLVVDADNDGWNSNSDCNDDDPNINPTATEIPNNDIDEDCDGIALIVDVDNDGFNSDDDCDDNNPTINPNSEEIPNNEIDEDCDGTILIIDLDGDGYNSSVDCNDNDININPGAEEIPNNEIDEDCDDTILIIDFDGDGFNSDEDCNDTNVMVYPGATEIPNNEIDEDCDGEDLIMPATHNLNGFKISIYPNPSKDFIYAETEQAFSYQIFSVDRKEVLSGSSALELTTIDISHLNSGVYLLLIIDETTNEHIIEQIVKI